jgi:hypothetical protein
MTSEPKSSEGIVLWPCGTQCYRENLEQMLAFMSADFEALRFGTPRWHELEEGSLTVPCVPDRRDDASVPGSGVP